MWYAGTLLAQRADSAQYYYDAGKEFASHSRLDSAIISFERSRKLSAPGSASEARACYAMGDIYKYDLFDFDKAESNFERALAIEQSFDNPDIKSLTRLYYNLATTNRSQSDHQTALSWCLKAIEGCKQMKDEAFLERAYSIVGNIYRDMHEFDSAVSYYKKGVTVNRSIHKQEDEALAALYGGWGGASYQQGDLDDAISKLGSSISIYKKITDYSESMYLHTVRLLAEVQIRNNDLAHAESNLKLADQIRKGLNIERGGPASSFHRTYGDYMMARGDNISAYGYYQKALQAATTEPLGRDGNPKDIEKVDFKSFAYDALLAKASVVAGADALECYSIAEKIMIASRDELETEEAKWSYIDANYKLYEKIFEVLIKDPDRSTSTIFRYMEHSKSKSLADALQEAELKKVIGNKDTLLTKLRDLRQQSISIQHQIDAKNESSARDALIANSQQISAVEASINAKYPSYIKTRYQDDSVSLEALKEKVADLDAVFVEYFWGYEKIYALVVTQDGPTFYQLGDSPAIEKEISRYHDFFTAKGNQYNREAVAGFASLSNHLFKSLLPFEEKLQHTRLVIVPDGPLMQLPFETLVTKIQGDTYKSLSYLLNEHLVSYVFSASHLLAARQSSKTDPSMLAFGFTGGRSERSFEASATEIAGSETELIALSDKFPGGTFLYGADVTERNFKEKASSFDLLHLAVHGSGDADEDYSATLYFRDKESPEDGRLYWYELYNMNLRAALTVLSSCESGIGKTYRGEGMLSMANAFTFAGCSNIVMGLWKVDDQVSVKLMDTFYSELLNGMAIDEALALAKRTYLASADQVSSNPKLWGSLVAYGESPILRADEIPTSWVVIALTALVAAITLLVVKTRKK